MNGVIRLASAPINWGITAPGEAGNPEPAELLASVAAAGYTGCEIGPFDYFGTTAGEINALFAEHNLDVVAFWVDVPLHLPLDTERREWLHGVCARLAAMNAPFLIVSDLMTDERLAIVGRVPHFPEHHWTEEDWGQVRLTLIDMAAICSEHGLTLAVHPHLGGHIESGDEVDKLIQVIAGTDARLCIDSGHIRIGGVDAIPILARELERTVHVHAKDIDESVLAQLQSGSIGIWDAVAGGLFCDLGTGMVDWQGFRNALVDGGYTGWVVAEEDRMLVPGSRAPYESNDRNYAFLRDLLGDAVAK
ncbi:MAG: TIM barrel protein [Thermomicrobiales bacterium]|nr:TIM barrel protein [Thermomicrobiales bacterium]